ncbi:HAD family hydrolase [Bacillus infantis]|uniref:HAD family hydrolase n=1 Tax=Bacillus infantis TaxID=324767 RepID=UPI00301840E2
MIGGQNGKAIKLKKEVRWIFFDAGGVLFDTPVKLGERVQEFLVKKGYSLSEIEKSIIAAKGIQTPFVTSFQEEEDFYKRFYGTMARELGEKALGDELFSETHYAAHCELYPEVIPVLEELSRNYELAVISNAMPSMDQVFSRLGIRPYFKTIILSAFVHTEKPDPAIYQKALDCMNAKGEESVFIDDKLINIEGAGRSGIKGFHLDRSGMDLAALLMKYNLLQKNLSG